MSQLSERRFVWAVFRQMWRGRAFNRFDRTFGLDQEQPSPEGNIGRIGPTENICLDKNEARKIVLKIQRDVSD